MEKTKELVLKYFYAWQHKKWDELRSCLNASFKIDAGKVQFESVDQFISFCQNGPSWSAIQLLDSLFQENKAALLYEGKTPTGEMIRVGEFLTIDQGKIVEAKASISLA